MQDLPNAEYDGRGMQEERDETDPIVAGQLLQAVSRLPPPDYDKGFQVLRPKLWSRIDQVAEKQDGFSNSKERRACLRSKSDLYHNATLGFNLVGHRATT